MFDCMKVYLYANINGYMYECVFIWIYKCIKKKPSAFAYAEGNSL